MNSLNLALLLALTSTLLEGGLGYGGFGGGEECRLRRMTRSQVVECPGLTSYSPWEEGGHEKCGTHTVHLSPEGTWKPTALASFGYAGSAWLRQLIERSSGFVTKGVYASYSRRSAKHQSEIQCGLSYFDGRTIIQAVTDGAYPLIPDQIKKHLSYIGEEISLPLLSKLHFNYKGILLVRNPWNTLLSASPAILRMRARGFQEQSFQNFMVDGAKEWIASTKTWIENSPDGKEMVIVKYEDLETHPERELRRVLNYLNVTVDEDRLRCALKDSVVLGQNGDKFRNLIPKVRQALRTGEEEDFGLTEGLKEINQLLEKKGIKVRLDYTPPAVQSFALRSHV